MMHKYDKKLNVHELRLCEACYKVGWDRVQHHVYGRRYDDRCIWVCVSCHAEIHANPEWAYKNKLLFKKDTTMSKEKKKKSCAHTKSYYDSRLGFIKCNYCGKQVESVNYGVKKSKKGTTASKKTSKMGYDDKQPPHIIEAAKLKTKYDVLKVKIKKCDDIQKKAQLEIQLSEIFKRMKALQLEFNLE